MTDDNEFRLFTLITDMKESLERQIESLQRQMGTGFDSVNARLDTMQARLDRQAGMIRAGQTAIARHDTWADTIDKLLGERDVRIARLEERLNKLEGHQ